MSKNGKTESYKVGAIVILQREQWAQSSSKVRAIKYRQLDDWFVTLGDDKDDAHRHYDHHHQSQQQSRPKSAFDMTESTLSTSYHKLLRPFSPDAERDMPYMETDFDGDNPMTKQVRYQIYPDSTPCSFFMQSASKIAYYFTSRNINFVKYTEIFNPSTNRRFLTIVMQCFNNL